jgi:hypothetical protein
MKLRILDNTLRLRLRKSEVVLFGEQGFLEATMQVTASEVFRYRLESSETCEAPMAFMSSHGITVAVPTGVARAWVESDDVAISGSFGSLEILIEKDFQRTSVKSLVDFDLYPNPRRTANPG